MNNADLVKLKTGEITGTTGSSSFTCFKKEQVSFNKAATQSSDISSTGGFASYAVDGDRITNSHTECTGDQWWEVDLGMMYDINRINVVILWMSLD